MDGYGIMKYSNNNTYIGAFKEGRIEGWDILSGRNQEVFMLEIIKEM